MYSRDPRLTLPTLKVLRLFLTSEHELAGSDVARTCRLASGSLYPILMRLEASGWLLSRWETDTPQAMGRPRKRLYALTGLGAQKTRVALRELRSDGVDLSLAGEVVVI